MKTTSSTSTGKPRGVNFSPGVALFYQPSDSHHADNSGLTLASGVHFIQPWGRRAEDPFRGLRAGPARSSPHLLFPHKSFPKPHNSGYRGLHGNCYVGSAEACPRLRGETSAMNLPSVRISTLPKNKKREASQPLSSTSPKMLKSR